MLGFLGPRAYTSMVVTLAAGPQATGIMRLAAAYLQVVRRTADEERLALRKHALRHLHHVVDGGVGIFGCKPGREIRVELRLHRVDGGLGQWLPGSSRGKPLRATRSAA